ARRGSRPCRRATPPRRGPFRKGVPLSQPRCRSAAKSGESAGRAAGAAFIFKAMDDIGAAVPALDGEAEAGAADAQVWPAVDAAAGGTLGEGGVRGEARAAAAWLLAQQGEAGTGGAIANGAAPDDRRPGRAIAVESAHRVAAAW